LTTVVCVKVGAKYGPEYVNRLAAMVARHITMSHRFVCLTDNPAGLTCPSFPIGTDLPGWWAKLVLFRPHNDLAGQRVVFLDLDTVIVGNMDFLLTYDGPFAILRDFYNPHGLGSAVMSIAPGFGHHIWDRFQGLGEHRTDTFWGDQAAIEAFVQHEQVARWQDLFPDKIVSYKVHCENGQPAGASVICFHGVPKPHEVKDSWILQNWTEQDFCATR
jgi:hypothetical protein